MQSALLFMAIGLLLIFMALARSVLLRLPLSTAILYVGIGLLLGPAGLGLFNLDPINRAGILERLAETAVLISLFTSGLKLSPDFRDGRWHIPFRLAFIGMAVTVGLIALVGVFALGLPVGAGILLGAILAPTDPVLASDVQVTNEVDRDWMRFGLTGEAGLNDGSAFPFVMLGLGLMGFHDIGSAGWRWLIIDLIWTTVAGLLIGAILGNRTGRLVLYLRSEHKEAVGLDEFLGLGLIALSYGVALLCHAGGFLAVFASGLALRRIEQHAHSNSVPMDVKAIAQSEEAVIEEIATNPHTAPAYMARTLLNFNIQLEHIGEVVVVIAVGVLLSASFAQSIAIPRHLSLSMSWLVPLLFLVIRPIAVWVSLWGVQILPIQRSLISWFGIRGIGSIYYAMYATNQGLSESLARKLIFVVLTVVAASIVVHGVSVTPLMNRYSLWMARRARWRARGAPATRRGDIPRQHKP